SAAAGLSWFSSTSHIATILLRPAAIASRVMFIPHQPAPTRAVRYFDGWALTMGSAHEFTPPATEAATDVLMKFRRFISLSPVNPSHWEHLVQFFRRRLAPVLAQLESLGVADRLPLLLAVTRDEEVTVRRGHAGIPVPQPVVNKLLSFFIALGHARQVTARPRIPIRKLRRHRVNAGRFLF